jgi:hypothetical protein
MLVPRKWVNNFMSSGLKNRSWENIDAMATTADKIPRDTRCTKFYTSHLVAFYEADSWHVLQ